MKRVLRILFIAGILGMLIAPTPVYAIADPDSPPQVTAVEVFEDLLEDGDAGVLIDYYLDYATNPTETATEAYMATFIDTDGVTQLKSVAPYTYQDSGYERGLIWIYFTEAEVTAYGIDSANEALYRVWLAGNPTLAWAGDPPKTIISINDWQAAGSDTAVMMALRVLYYADVLELVWSLDLIEETSLGNRLTTLGESYFTNVIPNLRTIAPSAFSAGTYDPVMEDLDLETSFGAVMTDETGTLGAGSPLTLAEGLNNVDIGVVGTFTLELDRGTEGTAESDVCNVTGTPVTLRAGTNTITTTAPIGNIEVDVELVNTQTGITDTVTGTVFDLTTVAIAFGMSRLMFSGLVWLLMTVVICAATYKVGHREGAPGGGKVILLVFDVCIIAGTVLGLLHMLLAICLFIMFGAFTGYVLFFKHAYV